MANLGGKIAELLNAVYNLSEEDKVQLDWAIGKLSEEDKEKILVAVYNRYKDFERNANKLTKGFQAVTNDLDESLERQEADKILLDI